MNILNNTLINNMSVQFMVTLKRGNNMEIMRLAGQIPAQPAQPATIQKVSAQDLKPLNFFFLFFQF